MPHPLDPIWIDAAAALGLRVERGGDSYVHFDGRILRLCADEHLDADDTVAQLVLHELCHSLVQGPENLEKPDWGLDNTSAQDHARELAAIRLQSHLTAAYGLRRHLFPTTPYRVFWDALARKGSRGALDATTEGESPDDLALSSSLSRAAALRAAREPCGTILSRSLTRSAHELGLATHPRTSFFLRDPLDEPRGCGTCAFRSPGGLCRRAEGRVHVRKADPACARHEEDSAVDCETCGACCRSAYDSVTVTRRDTAARRHLELVVHHDTYSELLRERGPLEQRCAALAGPPGGAWACTIYEDRPRTCRDFERGGRHCATARHKVGVSA